jgi:hypothetical protein
MFTDATLVAILDFAGTASGKLAGSRLNGGVSRLGHAGSQFPERDFADYIVNASLVPIGVMFAPRAAIICFSSLIPRADDGSMDWKRSGVGTIAGAG